MIVFIVFDIFSFVLIFLGLLARSYTKNKFNKLWEKTALNIFVFFCIISYGSSLEVPSVALSISTYSRWCWCPTQIPLLSWHTMSRLSVLAANSSHLHLSWRIAFGWMSHLSWSCLVSYTLFSLSSWLMPGITSAFLSLGKTQLMLQSYTWNQSEIKTSKITYLLYCFPWPVLFPLPYFRFLLRTSLQ